MTELFVGLAPRVSVYCLLLLACSGPYRLASSAPELTDGATDATSSDATITDASADNVLQDSSAARPTFEDDFNRNDGALENGWLGRGLSVMSILGMKVQVTPYPSYRDSIIYRPSSEAAQDVEVRVDVKAGAYAGIIPQVHARIQTTTVTSNNTLDSYLLYLDEDKSQAYLCRTLGMNPVDKLGSFQLVPAISAGQALRLHFRVFGSSQVLLDGRIEDITNEQAPKLLGSGTALDDTSSRITKPGTTGLSNYSEAGSGNSFSYDNFKTFTIRTVSGS